MNKLAAFILFFWGISTLFSLSKTQETMLSKLVNELSSTETYYLTYNTQNELLSESDILEYLIQKNISITNDFSFASHQIYCSWETNKVQKKFFLWDYSEMYFIVKISTMQDGKIVTFKKIKTEQNQAHAQSPKWYDPFMMTAIVGGLVYLFYFGNQ